MTTIYIDPANRNANRPNVQAKAQSLDLRSPPVPVSDMFASIEALASRASQSPFYARFAVVNLVGVALLAAAWVEGFLLKPFIADTSGICYLLVVVFAAGMVAVWLKDWQTVRWAGNALVYLGMVGTILGLILTVADISTDQTQGAAGIKAIVTAIYVGAGTALYSNLLACIGYLWLGTNAHLLARQEV